MNNSKATMQFRVVFAFDLYRNLTTLHILPGHILMLYYLRWYRSQVLNLRQGHIWDSVSQNIPSRFLAHELNKSSDYAKTYYYVTYYLRAIFRYDHSQGIS